jgi:hypothetical protein
MTLQQEILERLSVLPPASQQAVLSFARSLSNEGSAPRRPYTGLMGLLAGRPAITDDDIAEARREMWENFPRDVE